MIVLLYFGLLIVGFWFLLVRPQRRQIAARRALVASLEVGDEVVTAGGIHGTIRTLDERVVGLEIAPGVVIQVAREAVSGRPRPEPEEPDTVDLAGDDDATPAD